MPVKKLFGINSSNNQPSHHNNSSTTFMVVDDPSLLQDYYNTNNNNINQQVANNTTFFPQQHNTIVAASTLFNMNQQQQQANNFLNQQSSTSTHSQQLNNNNQTTQFMQTNNSGNNNFMMQQQNPQQSFNMMNSGNGNGQFNNSYGTNNNNNNNTGTNNNNNGSMYMQQVFGNNGMNNQFMFGQPPNNYFVNNQQQQQQLPINNNMMMTGTGNNNNNNTTSMMNNQTNNNNTTTIIQQQQQPSSSSNSTSLVNIVLNNGSLEKKYTPVIKWSVAPSGAYSFNNNGNQSGSTSGIINNEIMNDNIMSQTLIDPIFSQDDFKVAKGTVLTNTKLFCLSEQTLRDYQYLRPSVQTDNLYHLAEMEQESSWLPNDRIAPKKTTHNCLVNDWLVFCSQDPQLLKLVGRHINGSSNNDVQLFADFVLVTSNNHEEDSRESLFGKQRFKGGIPLQMKLVRNSAINQGNMTPLLYFEKRINRESVNNKEAPSASGMGGKRVAQLRIYLKDSQQEICLVHSDGFWVRTKSREEVNRTSISPRDAVSTVQPPPVTTTQATTGKKKRHGFYPFGGLFQGGSNARLKREAMIDESTSNGNSDLLSQQQSKIVFQQNGFGNQPMVGNQPGIFNQQPLDFNQMTNSASSYGSSSYLSTSGNGTFILQSNMSPGSNQVHLQNNGGNDQSDYSSLSSTPNNTSNLSVSQHSLSATDVAEILRNLTISLPQNNGGGGGHHSRNSSFTSPSGLASSCSSTSSSSYLVGNTEMTHNNNFNFQNFVETPNGDIDSTITKLDAAINFFSSMKEAFVKMKENQGDAPNMSELYAQFSSSLQDKRGKEKGFKRVRQGNDGAVSPQSNHSGKSQLSVPYRNTSSSAPNASTFNLNGTSPLVNGMMSNAQFANTSFNGNNTMPTNQVMVGMNQNTNMNVVFQNNMNNMNGGFNNLPLKNFDGNDLPHTLFNSADTDASQDIFNM